MLLHTFLYFHPMFTSRCVCVCVKTCDGVPHVLSCAHTVSVLIIISPWACSGCSEPHQRGLWLGGRGVGGGLAPLRSFLPPPQGARHSVYHWQAEPDDEAACTANTVFEQGRGWPRHAEHIHASKNLIAHTHLHTADSRWVRRMFGRCCRGETKCVESNLTVTVAVCAGEKPHRQTLGKKKQICDSRIGLRFMRLINVCCIIGVGAAGCESRRIRSEM